MMGSVGGLDPRQQSRPQLGSQFRNSTDMMKRRDRDGAKTQRGNRNGAEVVQRE